MNPQQVKDWIALTTVEREVPRSRYARISAPDVDSSYSDVVIAAVSRIAIMAVFVLWAFNARSTGFRVIFVVFTLWWVFLTWTQLRTFLRDRRAIEAGLEPGASETL